MFPPNDSDQQQDPLDAIISQVKQPQQDPLDAIIASTKNSTKTNVPQNKPQQNQQPTILSRLGEQGEGLVNFLGDLVKVGIGHDPIATLQAAQTYSQPFKDIAQGNILSGVSKLAGFNPDAIKSDYSAGRYGPLAADVIPQIAVAGLLHKIGGGEVPEELPKPTVEPEPQPQSVIRGLLPASTETQPTRFFQGPAGTADANMAYLLDTADQAKLRPDIGGTLTPSEHGQIVDVGPLIAANRMQPEVLDPAQANSVFRALVPNRYSGVVDKPAPLPAFPKHSPEALAQTIDSNPQTAGLRPDPDVINSTPVDPVHPDDITVPRAGQLNPTPLKNPLLLQGNFGTTALLRKYAPNVIQPLIDGWNQMIPFERQSLQELAKTDEGLDAAGREQLGRTLNGEPPPNDDIAQRAITARSILDSIYQVKSPTGLGYLDDYFTHMAPKNTSLMSYYFGNDNPLLDFVRSSNIPADAPINKDFYETSLGNTDSPFFKQRTGQLSLINYDTKDVFPAYVKSAARDIFLGPASDAAKSAADNMPAGQMRELANWAIKNVTGYDAEQNLAQAWGNSSRALGNMMARSYYGVNPFIHGLHATQLATSVWPELGTKYAASGLQQMLMHPVDSWSDIAKNGLIPSDVDPWNYKTFGQKADSFLQFNNAIERFVKGIGYLGAKQRALDQGLNPDQATLKAIDDTKSMTYSTESPYGLKGFSPESNFGGGQFGSNILWQGKKLPLKMAEDVVNTMYNWKQNRGKAARMVAGLGLTSALIGPHLLNEGTGLLGLSNPFYSAMKNVYSAISKGDFGGALTELGLIATPGGQEIKRLAQ